MNTRDQLSHLKPLRTAALALLVLLTGCTAQHQPSSGDMARTAKKLEYFKDSHGLCYAEIESDSYGAFHIIAIANVPCKKVGL